MAIAMGLHVRVGIEDNLGGRKGERMTSSVQQVEQIARLSRELYREIATGEEARRIYQIGTHYETADETLSKLGYAPKRRPGERGVPMHGATTPAVRRAA
jgi:hypothetical protein